MARKVRIEYPGACYHVINRGNYRNWIFETDGAKESFRECLVEVCGASAWRLHGWCLMGNHYHLALETPKGNLVEGMRWLQSTFANRFNRFRGLKGHVFQGRYQAILADSGSLGAVGHYIHLNPVRAGIVGVEALKDYRWSSFQQLWFTRHRWACQDFGGCLKAAGGLTDTPAGRRKYRAYLGWLAGQSAEQRKLGFERMSRGWAMGTKSFREQLQRDHEVPESQLVEAEARELRAATWEQSVAQGLKCLGKVEADLEAGKKGAAWKVALARSLRQRHLAPNAWIAHRLSMGKPGTVSQYVNHQKRNDPEGLEWRKLKNTKMLD